jgi:hypothetical protein
MKFTTFLAAASALVLVASANAQTQINITGATAFRAAAHQTIRNGFTSLEYGFTSTSLGNSNQAIFRGTFAGIPGTTVIRTNFAGSIAGIKSVVLNQSVNFISTNATLSTSGTASISSSLVNDPVVPKFAFSDSEQTSTPFTSPTLGGGPVGVVAFAMVANQGTPANLTNVTAQQFRALWSNGFQPLSLFTGSAADSGVFVYATGRNDGSGTRTTYMAESGLGIPTVVTQWKVTGANETNTSLQLWPAADGVNASTVWGNDVAGNGGYDSGSFINALMGRNSDNVSILDNLGNEVATGQKVVILSWISTTDAASAVTNGGKVLAFNGVSVTPVTGASLSATDIDKIAYGQYTAWSFQQLFHRGALSAEESTFRAALETGLNDQSLLLNNGIALAAMQVSRPQDGGTVAP